MTKLLEKAIKKLDQLPGKEQEMIVRLLLDEIQWEHSLEKSADKLKMLAKDALKEHKQGKTLPFRLK